MGWLFSLLLGSLRWARTSLFTAPRLLSCAAARGFSCGHITHCRNPSAFGWMNPDRDVVTVMMNIMSEPLSCKSTSFELLCSLTAARVYPSVVRACFRREAVILLRKVTIVAITVFVPDEFFQVFISCFAIVLFLLAHIVVKPFSRPRKPTSSSLEQHQVCHLESDVLCLYNSESVSAEPKRA